MVSGYENETRSLRRVNARAALFARIRTFAVWLVLMALWFVLSPIGAALRSFLGL